MTALTSVMLGTRDADRLHAWYTTVLTPDTDDRTRDDVEAAHPDPARTILNLEVDDARGVAARVEEAGGTWVAPLEDRDGSLFATVQDPDGPLPGGLLADEAFSGFSVDDLDAARRFYGGALGLTVRDEAMGLISIQLGPRRVLVYPKEDHRPATYTVLNFPVADVGAAVRALGERGVEFLRYDGFGQDELGVARGQGPDIAWFADPAGNVLSVLSPVRGT